MQKGESQCGHLLSIIYESQSLSTHENETPVTTDTQDETPKPCIAEKTGKICTCHCTCMAGMGQSCTHLAAAMFKGKKAAVRNGLKIPSCTSSSNEWFSCRKDVKPSKITNLNSNQEGFGDRGKQKWSLVSTPKKDFKLFGRGSTKSLTLNDFVDVLKSVALNSIVHTAVPPPDTDFEVKAVLSEGNDVKSFISVTDIIDMSGSKSIYFENLKMLMTRKKNSEIEA